MARQDEPSGAVLVITVHLDEDGPGEFLAVLRADPGADTPTVLRCATRAGVMQAVGQWLDALVSRR